MNNKDLIIRLIKDDLTNNKLIDGLNDLGMEADHYHLYLSEIIFDLIGFKIDNTTFDRVYGYYDKLTKGANTIDIKKRDGSMDKLAKGVYNELYLLKETLEQEKRK